MKNEATLPKEKLSWSEASRRRRAELREADLSHSGADKSERIDLGLALLSLHAIPGVCYTYDEIACWCGCTETAIFRIERTAIKKLCNALRFRNPELWQDLRIAFFDRQSPAQAKERIAA